MFEKLKRDLEALRDEVRVLRKLALHCRQVDLVDWGGLRAFMYMDDLTYFQVEERFKHSNDTAPRPPGALPTESRII